MSENKKNISEILDEKIPRAVVSERDGGGGRRLSYLEGHYVIDRLNKVFGHLGWSNEITEIKEVVNKTSKGEYPAYLVKVRLKVHTTLANGMTQDIIKEGYGYGADKSSMNAHELAIKEAVTDALKVAAKNLGQSMGLALYDKTQENVSDEEETKEVPTESKSASAAHNGNGASKEEVSTDAAKIQEAIKSAVRVAVKLQKITVDQFKKEFLDNKSLADLDVSQLKKVLSDVQALTGGK